MIGNAQSSASPNFPPLAPAATVCNTAIALPGVFPSKRSVPALEIQDSQNWRRTDSCLASLVLFFEVGFRFFSRQVGVRREHCRSQAMELGIPATPAAPLFESEAWAEGQAATFTLPTLQQQAAITELKDFSEDKIFAWLALIRSLEHGYRHRNTAGGLSCQQVSAISTLKDCNDSNIINWLRTIDVPSMLRSSDSL